MGTGSSQSLGSKLLVKLQEILNRLFCKNKKQNKTTPIILDSSKLGMYVRNAIFFLI